MRRSDWNWLNQWEKNLIRLALLGISLMLISQCLLANPQIRPFLSRVDKLEGVSVLQDNPNRASNIEFINQVKGK